MALLTAVLNISVVVFENYVFKFLSHDILLSIRDLLKEFVFGVISISFLILFRIISLVSLSTNDILNLSHGDISRRFRVSSVSLR